MCWKVKPCRWGDLLQIQAPESYSLLAIKSLAFLSWTQRILPQVSNQHFHQLCHLQTIDDDKPYYLPREVPYLVKTDDDVVYSLENLHK